VIGLVEEWWKRIAGLHVTEAGDIGVVWLAHDKDADTIHLYNCAMLRHQPQAVIIEGLTALGRWIPMAWEAKQKPTRDMLMDHGLNLIDPVKEDAALAEITSREIADRMVTGRFKVPKRLSSWLSEYKTFYRSDTTIPRDSHPLMAATRYAVAQIKWAKAVRPKGARKRVNHVRIAMI
jgi:hypothetical protein